MVDTTSARALMTTNINDNTTGDVTAADVRAVISSVLDGIDAAAASTVTISAGTGLTGGGTLAANRTLSLNVNGLTADGSPDGTADYVVTYDTSAATHKKVLLNNLPGGGGGGGTGKSYFAVNIVSDYGADPSGNTGSATANTTAFQNAINALAAARGGTIFVPSGRYILNATLVLPNMANGDDSWNAIEIQGEGFRNSILEWPTDLGSGQFALRATNRVTNYVRTQISDIAFIGPRDVDTLGSAPAQMSGIGISNRFLLRRVEVQWFYSGIDILGDHSFFDYCEFTKNYYGAYWGNDATNRGDHYFNCCEISGNKFAGLAVNPVNNIDGTTFTECHIGFQPYGIYCETGTRTLGFLTFSTFLDCSFEACGNGIIHSDTSGANHSVSNCLFIQCSSTQNNGWKIAARAFTGFIKLSEFARTTILGNHGFFSSYQTAPTAYIVGNFSGHFEDFWGINITTSVPFASGNGGATYKHWDGHSGIIAPVFGSCVAGDLLGDSFDGYALMPSGTTIAGVAVYAATDKHTLIAQQGGISIRKTSGVAIAVGVPVQSNATNRNLIETATSSTRPIAGVTKFSAASGDATAYVRLQITHRM
jgi:hypothetical protein